MSKLNFYIFVLSFFSLGIVLGLDLINFLFKTGSSYSYDAILLLCVIMICNLMIHNLQNGDNLDYRIIPQLFN